jgi:hypothetical protein
VSGNSAELLREYLDNVLRLLTSNAHICVQVEPLLQDKTTFIFVKRFLKVNRSRPDVTIPLAWYQ